MTLSPIRKLAMASALPLVLALSGPAMAADPTVDQVYSAAKSGHVDDALTQMQQVLKDHPNSAKAHFIEAELLAKSGKTAEARTELAKAEQLKPGLPFAKPASVSALKAQLSTRSTTTSTRTEVVQQPQRESHGFPWVPVIVIAGLIFLVIAFLRRRSAAANEAYYAPPANPGFGAQPYGNPGPQGGPWPGGGYQGGGYQGGPGYGAPGYGAPPPQQGGIGGGGIMSSLAGGAAAGAGFAAGEAVIGKMFGDHDREKIVERDVPVQSHDEDDRRNTNQDMGGDDFGISDSGSWDDGGSSGGNDDW
jgi:hypothetical protein